MLLDRASTTQNFSDPDASEEINAPMPRSTALEARHEAVPNQKRVQSGERNGVMVPGDQVVFARLDVAEALGIWRHATGRVVDTHAEAQAVPEGKVTIDVQFEGHETLHRYLPDLFEKRMN